MLIFPRGDETILEERVLTQQRRGEKELKRITIGGGCHPGGKFVIEF